MRSLQGKLLLGTAVGTTVVLSAAGVSLYVLVHMSLTREFDAALAAKAQALATLAEQDDEQVGFEAENLDMPEFRASSQPEYFQAWAGGHTLARSQSLAARDLERVGGPVEAPEFRAITLPDGRRGRLVGITFSPRMEDEAGKAAASTRPAQVTLVLARATASLDRTLARLGLLLAGVWASAIALTLGVLAIVVRRGLRPMGQLATRIGQVGEADLAARITLPDAPAELMPVIQRLNDLLGRLDAAFARERTFSADIAHELRTPLAGLRSTLDVTLSRTRDTAQYAEAMTGCLGIARQMQDMVEQLLCLAKVDNGAWSVTRDRCDLAAIATECWAPLQSAAQARGLAVEWLAPQPCDLRTDPEKLKLVVRNVLDNAVCHADAGGRVRFEVFPAVRQVCLRATNTGSKVAAEDAHRVFDRFWRADAARTDTGMHCGLGLSLCKRIVELLGGTIEARSQQGGEFTIEVRFAGESFAGNDLAR
jgi:two-component system sensor histidine kinase QseC